ncbi:MAG TPA: hypothetical protein V6C88_18045 [Chroococcidiopsis sp.]
MASTYLQNTSSSATLLRQAGGDRTTFSTTSNPLRSSSPLNAPLDAPSSLTRAASSSSAQKSVSTRATAKKSIIPRRLTFYDIIIRGATYYGNTALPQTGTVYTIAQRFFLAGIFSVEPGIRPANSFRNKPNARDIGFFVNNADPKDGIEDSPAGSLWLGTNSKVLRHVDSDPGNAPSLDVAVVTVSGPKNTITVKFDGTGKRTDIAGRIRDNRFKWSSSPFTTTKQVLTGTIRVKFSQGGRAISGSLILEGVGTQPGAFAYNATFSGTVKRL